MNKALRRALYSFALCVNTLAGTAALAQTPNPQGQALPGLEAFDAEVTKLMQDWDVPGGGQGWQVATGQGLRLG